MKIDLIEEVHSNLRAEWGKTWSVKVPALWLLGAVFVCAVTASSLANDFVHSISTGEQSASARMPVIDSLGSAVTFAQVAVVGFAIHLVTPEYSSGSIGPTLMAQPRRGVVVVAKALTAAMSAGMLGLVLGAVTAKAIELILGDSVGQRIDLTAAGLGTAAIFACAAVIGTALAFLLRSAVGALCAGFVVLIVTVAAPDAVGRWLPGRAQASWLAHVGSGAVGMSELGVLLAWTSAMLAAAVWLLRRRDA